MRLLLTLLCLSSCVTIGDENAGPPSDRPDAAGQGTFTFANGDKYVGETKQNLYTGKGTYYFLGDSNFRGDRYVGEWKNGTYDGQGTYYFLANNEQKGDIYKGEYKKGLFDGEGTYTSAKGNKYAGGWKESTTDKERLLTLMATSMSEIGRAASMTDRGQSHLPMATDILVTGKRQGRGNFIYADGIKHSGPLQGIHASALKKLSNFHLSQRDYFLRRMIRPQLR